MSEHLADSSHLSGAMLSALADGELAGEELRRVQEHLAQCAECTRSALGESLLKRAVARGGQRYAMPEGLRERVMAASSHVSESRRGAPETAKYGNSGQPRGGVQNDDAGVNEWEPPWVGRSRRYGWIALAAVLLVCASTVVAVWTIHDGGQQTAVVNEAVDEHIAAMAAGGPEVVSSDRHTVKPWFQGKLPFSFNLPEQLPEGMTLDGANLVQVEGQPAAQLLFSIGKHKASVFVRQRGGERGLSGEVERNGFHVQGVRTRELGIAAVSDVDPARLRALAEAVGRAQE